MESITTLPPTALVQERELNAQGRHVLDAATLPPRCYWAPELYELEIERIFLREWIFVGRVEDVPNPGDFFTINVVGEPLIVVRDGDGEIRVHLNVCRHRGCQVAQGSGQAKSFRCPYHGWMYGLNGELRGVPDFSETRDFAKSEYPLRGVKTEIWESNIMVNFDDAATPFRDRVSDMTRWGIEKYRSAEHVTTHKWEFDVACNWKVYVENYIEEYHVPWVHPETFQIAAPMKGWKEFVDISDQPWSVMIGQFPGLSFSDTGEPAFPITPDTAELAPEHQGMPIWISYPSFGLLHAVDSTMAYSILPNGPRRCDLKIRLMLPPESVQALTEGDPEVTAAADMYSRNVDAFVAEDNAVCEQQQIGLQSHLAAAGRYSKHEGLAWAFDKWVADVAYRPSVHGNGSV